MHSLLITYYAETNLICFLFVSFLLYHHIREYRGLAEAKWFRFALVTVLVYCVADVVAAIFKNQVCTGARIVLWISNSLYITIPLILIIFWNLYITEHMRAYFDPGKVFRLTDRVLSIISIIICAISLSTPITHSTFYLDELNGYHRELSALMPFRYSLTSS